MTARLLDSINSPQLYIVTYYRYTKYKRWHVKQVKSSFTEISFVEFLDVESMLGPTKGMG